MRHSISTTLFSKRLKTELGGESALAISKKNGPKESSVDGACKSKYFNGIVSAEKNNFHIAVLLFSLACDLMAFHEQETNAQDHTPDLEEKFLLCTICYR